LSGIDITLIIIILLGAYGGYREGFLMELFSFLAIVLGVLGGFKLMGQAMILLTNKFNVDKVVLPYIAFGVVFIIIVIVVTLLGRLIKASIDKNFLGRVDQAAGALLGMLKVTFLVSVAIWIMNSLRVDTFDRWAEGSRLYPKVASFAPMVTNVIGKFVPVFKDIF
jgi:membrane protein required for colicin V production